MPEDKAFFTSNNSCDRTKQEAISALCALGYKPQDASKMVYIVKIMWFYLVKPDG
jgi:Holliday junction resolvasome RuvABC DNA-binding subunit